MVVQLHWYAFVVFSKRLKTDPVQVICFILLGIMLLFTVSALAELAVAYPVNGAFFTHTVKFLDPAWGFAMGWKCVQTFHSACYFADLVKLRHVLARRVTSRIDCCRYHNRLLESRC